MSFIERYFKTEIKSFSEGFSVVVRRTVVEGCDLWSWRSAEGMGDPDSVLFTGDVLLGSQPQAHVQ